MSKIGNKLIQVPAGVEIALSGNTIEVKGKEGVLSFDLPPTITVEKKDDTLSVKSSGNDNHSKAIHGLIRSLISNATEGVIRPWEKRLEVVGTGYRVKLQGQDLVFEVGYSHSITFKKIEGVTYMVEGNNKVVVKGSNKQQVGEVAHKIKLLKKPDPYKGKGIRYEGEQIKLKPGKKAKAATGAK